MEAAEHAGHELLRQAEAEAERYLEERRAQIEGATTARLELLSAVADSLVEQALGLRRSMDAVAAALREATGLALDTEPDGLEPPPAVAPRAAAATPAPLDPDSPVDSPRWPARRFPPRASADVDPAEPPFEPAGSDDPGPTTRVGADRLVAMQMAVAGSSREQIDDHLREAFQVSDPSPILDDLFGDQRP